LTGRSGRFALGIELLTGLAIGAAALAAFVAFALSMLGWSRMRGEVDARAQFTASAVAAMMGDSPTRASFRDAAEGLPAIDDGLTLALADGAGRVVETAGAAARAPDSLGGGEWFSVPAGSGGLTVAVRPDYGDLPGLALPVGLGVLAGGLTVLALLAPGHLRRRVLRPLQSILDEAESFSPGQGRDAETASVSFRRLVERLRDREQTLSRLRREAERRADVVESRSRAVLDAMGSAVLTLDPEGRLEMSNPVAEGMLVSDEAGEGAPFREVATPLGLEMIGRHPPGSGGGSGFQLEHEGDAGRRVLNVTASTTAEGEITYLVTDVTAAAEMERRIVEEKAMADLGAVSAGVSHEMGNSLCAIGGFLDLIARGDLDERSEGVLSEARREVASARRMVESFRSMAGPSGADLEPMEAGDIGDLVAAECREAGVSFESRIEPVSDHLVSSHPELVRRCVRNLLKNALEAGGGDVEVGLSAEGSTLLLSVADRGHGLPCEPERLFSPFFTTKEAEGSGNMGLGLTITRRIVGVLGGDLSAADRPGGGAVFRIRMPLVERSG
jgi:C4-dicarboxylate-specific signal transduction histidine kinase